MNVPGIESPRADALGRDFLKMGDAFPARLDFDVLADRSFFVWKATENVATQ